MSDSGDDDLASALRKLSMAKFKKENLPKRDTDPLWDRLLSPPFNMDLNEAYALKNSVLNPPPAPVIVPTATSNPQRPIDLAFSGSPCGDLMQCLDKVPDVSLRVALLGPGPCLLNGLPPVIVSSNHTVIGVNTEMMEGVLAQLQRFVKSLNPATKSNMKDEHLMAIRL